ncbi:MAG: hypothetical protein ABSF85_00920 [Terriglobales bacterium]
MPLHLLQKGLCRRSAVSILQHLDLKAALWWGGIAKYMLLTDISQIPRDICSAAFSRTPNTEAERAEKDSQSFRRSVLPVVMCYTVASSTHRDQVFF